MLFSTTPTLEGHTIARYHGLVTFEAIIGANAVVGMRLDYEVFGSKGMMLVIAYGTAVTTA